MPTEKMDSAKILGDFTFLDLSDVAWCSESKCGYRSCAGRFPDCCGGVQDSEFAFCWPFIVKTGCRNVAGAKFKKCETCCRGGGYNCCIATACAFPPDDKVPLGCGCCGMGMVEDVTLKGIGVDFEESKNEVSMHSVCCCYHCGLFWDSESYKCCGAHQQGENLCFTTLTHMALDPIEAQMKSRASCCCEESTAHQCPKPCWPFCMFQDDALCC